MSDSVFPPATGESATDAAGQGHLGLDASGIGPSGPEDARDASDGVEICVNGDEAEVGDASPATALQHEPVAEPDGDKATAAEGELFLDTQPMLDLRFPEEAEALSPDAASQEEPDGRLGTDHDEAISEALPNVSEGVLAPNDVEVVAAGDDDRQPLEATFEELPAEVTETLEASQADASRVTIEDPSGGESQDDRQVEDTGRLANEPDDGDDSRDLDRAPTGAEDVATERKIAAEADATAQALENLKRLLAHKLPDLTAAGSLAEQGTPPAPPPIEPPVPSRLEPVDYPDRDEDVDIAFTPAEDSHGRGGRLAVGSFLAGFAASWVFGAALYAYLVFG